MSSLLCLPSTRLTGVYQLFTWVLGLRTQVPTLAQQSFSCCAIPRVPGFAFLKKSVSPLISPLQEIEYCKR